MKPGDIVKSKKSGKLHTISRTMTLSCGCTAVDIGAVADKGADHICGHHGTLIDFHPCPHWMDSSFFVLATDELTEIVEEKLDVELPVRHNLNIESMKKKSTELVKNDLIYMKYGKERDTFRVTRCLADGVEAHSLKWMKRDYSTFIFDPANPFILTDEKYLTLPEAFTYVGRMSGLKAFFLL